MNETVNNRKHVLTDKAPIIVAVVLMLITSLTPGFLISTLVEEGYPLITGVNIADYMAQHEGNLPPILMPSFFIGSILFSIIVFLVFEWWFKPEYEGSMHIRGFKEGFLFSLPVYIFWIVWFIIQIAIGSSEVTVHSFGDLIYVLLQGSRAGFVEEIAYRGIGMAIMLRYFKNKNNIWIPTILTALLFGFSHIFNILSGDDPLGVIVQTLFATFFGVIFCLIFTYSGNIWAPILLHALYDATTFGISSTADGPTWTNAIDVAGPFVLMIILFVIFMKNKESILDLWKKKWKN